MFGTIDGQKLKEKRGQRSLLEIVNKAKELGFSFSDVALLKWEREQMQPKTDNIRALLKVYNCRLEEIAKPLELI